MNKDFFLLKITDLFIQREETNQEHLNNSSRNVKCKESGWLQKQFKKEKRIDTHANT